LDRTDKEFHRMFKRISRRVSFKGCKTPAEVNGRLVQKYRQEMYVPNANPLQRLHAENRADKYRRLVPYFGEEVIAEAHAKPNGFIAQVLHYGREKGEAKFKQLKQWRLDRKYKRKRR
jgi:hypothetical protein